MKKKRKLITIITLLFGVAFFQSNAQNAPKTYDLKYLKKKIDSVFIKTFNNKFLSDSVALYAMNFKLEIVKNEKGKAVLTKVIADDNLGLKLFPAYKRLYTLDYTSLSKGKKKFNIIIPVIISNTSQKAKSKYAMQNGKALIDIESASDIYVKAISSLMTEKSNWLEDVILFKPYTVRILNIE